MASRHGPVVEWCARRRIAMRFAPEASTRHGMCPLAVARCMRSRMSTLHLKAWRSLGCVCMFLACSRPWSLSYWHCSHWGGCLASRGALLQQPLPGPLAMQTSPDAQHRPVPDRNDYQVGEAIETHRKLVGSIAAIGVRAPGRPVPFVLGNGNIAKSRCAHGVSGVSARPSRFVNELATKHRAMAGRISWLRSSGDADTFRTKGGRKTRPVASILPELVGGTQRRVCIGNSHRRQRRPSEDRAARRRLSPPSPLGPSFFVFVLAFRERASPPPFSTAF